MLGQDNASINRLNLELEAEKHKLNKSIHLFPQGRDNMPEPKIDDWSTEDWIKKLKSQAEESREYRYKLYDKVSNLLDWYCKDPAFTKQYHDFTRRLADDVEQHYGQLKIVHLARALLLPA